MTLSSLLLCCTALYLILSTTTTAALYSNPDALSNCTRPGVAVFTVDDGPGYYVDKLLEVLKHENVSATFFLWGEKIQERPEAIQRIMNSGHQVALHGYTRTSFDNMSSSAAIEQDLTRNSNLVFQHGGVRPGFIRVPYDQCDTIECQKVITKMGLKQVLYNAYIDEGKHIYRSEDDATRLSIASLTNTLKKAEPNKDSIILLLHETHPFSVYTLAPQVIDMIRQKGYKFVSLSECLGYSPYKQCSYKRSYPDHLHSSSPIPHDHHQHHTTSSSTTTIGNSNNNNSISPNNTHTTTPTPGATGNPPSGAQMHKVATWTFGLGAVLAYMLA
ncbi:chitin deacetylase [Mortierella antarctica]|nr:chitin deacetylase [Mortierella antarctica]